MFFFITNRVAEVAKGVVELIEDDTKIGEVLVVCMVDGTKYKQFTNKVGLFNPISPIVLKVFLVTNN